jgi:hypothetical protein
MTRLLWSPLLTVVVAACAAPPAADEAPPPAACDPLLAGGEGEGEGEDVDDRLSPTRLLRRASFVLRGRPPTVAEVEAVLARGDDGAQRAAVDEFVDAALADPAFYTTLFELGFRWMNIPLVASTADAPEYGVQQQVSLLRCPEGTPNAGAWRKFREFDGCESALTTDVEPWWAPGTTETLAGSAANTTNVGVISPNGTPTEIACDGGVDGTCGCGPAAVRCHPDFQEYNGFEDFLGFNTAGQRRQIAEEPARFFAHLAWFDRSLDELLLSHRSVGTTNVQAAYVQQGIEGGRLELLDDDSWWKTERFVGADHDPLHTAGDAESWREFDVSTRNPFFLAARDTQFDPRVDVGAAPGIPAAGVLTSLGFLAGYPRERLRAARALETFACEDFEPPQGLTFNTYERDPAVEGSCQHCHRRIDPAAIHFKRYAKEGSAFEGFGARYHMPGVGDVWHYPTAWTTGEFPFGGEPFAQWRRWYTPDTRMTPVTAAQAAANPEVVFIDFLPDDQTLLGQTSDGTIGPLGFAKMIIDAGAFDRCVVRQLHKHVMGRDIDPTREAGYLDALTARFVDDGRVVRPFVRHLLASDLFGRGL